MSENNENMLEPIVDAFMEFTILLAQILFKASGNLLVFLTKYISECIGGLGVIYQLITHTYPYENKQEQVRYEGNTQAFDDFVEVASTETGVSILSSKIKDYKSDFKEYKTSAIDLDYIPLEPLSINRELPSYCKYRSNNKVNDNTLIAYPGVMEGGKPLAIDFYEQGSLLVGGMSRWGKTSFILSMLTSLMERYSPSELKLILVDFKGVDLVHLSNYKHVLSNCITSIDNFKSVLEWTSNEVEKRAIAFKKAKVTNIKEYNAKNSNMKFQSVIIVVDEIALMLNGFSKKQDADNMRNEIARIVSISMAFGIYWVVCTQELSRETLGKMKNNFAQRIGFHTADKDATDLIIKDGELEEIKFPGRGKLQNSSGIKEFQSYYIKLEEVFEKLEKYLK